VCRLLTGLTAERGVGRLRIPQELGQHPGQHAVLGVLQRQPGMVDGLAQFGQRQRLGRCHEERTDLVVPLQRGTDLVDLDLIDAVDVVGPPHRVASHEHLDVELQHVGDLMDDGEPVQPPHAALDLVDPALGLAQTIGEELLRHSPAVAPVRNPAAHRKVVHDDHSPRTGHRLEPTVESHIMCGGWARLGR
jgi:hypothetical protein